MATPASMSATAVPAPEMTAPWPPGVLLRDIAAGGIAGIVAGIVVAGIGGRIAMRLAAILVPSAAGLGTANGNRVGEITLEGTAALILFEGLFVGMTGGVLWVTVRPWMPSRLLPRLLLAMVVAVSIGTTLVIEGTNPDFRILGFSPVVVGVLLVVVALFGPAVAILEWLLDRHLPVASHGSKATVAYALLAVAGLTLALPLAIQGVLLGSQRPIGIGLAVTGIATLAWWTLRARGRATAPASVRALGRGSLAASVILGLWLAVPEIAAALGAG